MLDAKPGTETAEAAFVAEDPAAVVSASGKPEKLEIDRYFEAVAVAFVVLLVFGFLIIRLLV